MQYSNSNVNGVFSAVRSPAYPFYEPSAAPLSTPNLPSFLSQYRSSSTPSSNPLFSVGQQQESYYLPPTHTHHHLVNATPPTSTFLGRHITPQAVPDDGYGPASSNAVSQSTHTPPAPYSCDSETSESNLIYGNMFAHPHMLGHNAPQWADDSRTHEVIYDAASLRPSSTPENIVFQDTPYNDSQNRGESCSKRSDSHMELLCDEPFYGAPQLTSPANQRAATARRKREAKYPCDMCGSKLTAKHNLASHMNAHFGIKPFRCNICKREYTAKSTYRRHMKTVHGK